MLKYDIKKNGKTNLIDLILTGAEADYAVTSADFTVVKVTAGEDSEAPAPNTTVTIKVVPGSTVVNNESPDRDLKYRRQLLADIVGTTGAVLTFEEDLANYPDEASIVAKFVALTGIKFDEGELTVTRTATDEKITGQVAVTAGHHGIMGSVDMVITAPVPELPTLKEAFPTDNLNGFEEIV